MNHDVYIIAAARTPIGRLGGTLASLSPVALGAQVMQAALERSQVPGEALDLYIMGNVLRSGHGQLVPRQAALKAGIPASVNGFAIDMVCASGMMSLLNAMMAIRAGEADLVLAGGMESMSQTGFFLSHRARWGYKLLAGAPEPLTDLILQDGLTDGTTGESMGEQAERVAATHDFSRYALDEVALESHRRASAARDRGLFQAEIMPIEVKTKHATQIVDRDEGIRPDTTLESLMKLRPAFKPDGILTAGNSSQLSDGAAALVLASATAVKRYQLTPSANLLGGTWAGGETWRFPELSIVAVKQLLEKLSLKLSDIDLFENNEAFAVNNLLFQTWLSVPADKLNSHGGAIALGHPLGASGARLVVTLLHTLKQQQQTLGIASICHGTGGGTAIALEHV
ncbi:thiolase family protein [Stenomitos frigidus]|uniref:acetyl-CoA C-acetyltransferase n=1 Tax=Stenomitos frigidus ULC18 TaxID=2107698 RepID=A0A2T1EH93_9CYAN|nr:thiolase family protein [Stenomitos frigidus]PSB32055.1 acetyl-CoA C-acyltransferase [Stenomitos frigidus ULC18]